MQTEKNVLLRDYTSFKIGGPADEFVIINSIEEAQEAIQYAQAKSMPIFILGGGTNVLFSDQGWRGLVIKLNLQQLKISANQVIVGSGVLLSYLLNKCLENNLTGLEFAAGVPGTVGGAVRGNAGTYGRAMSDVVKEIVFFDQSHVLRSVSVQDAHFAYRHSIFKEQASIILEINLELQRGDIAHSRALVVERLKYRQDTQPNEPSAGCIFKNIEFSQLDLPKLRAKNIDVDKFATHQKIPASYLIDQAGLKGYRIGGAQVSDKHANYIINVHDARAEEVLMLISFIKQQVRDKYGVQLQEEVQLVF